MAQRSWSLRGRFVTQVTVAEKVKKSVTAGASGKRATDLGVPAVK